VAPSLAALAGIPSSHRDRDLLPIVIAVDADQLGKLGVFLRAELGTGPSQIGFLSLHRLPDTATF
jgi:hypothetical protein